MNKIDIDSIIVDISNLIECEKEKIININILIDNIDHIYYSNIKNIVDSDKHINKSDKLLFYSNLIIKYNNNIIFYNNNLEILKYYKIISSDVESNCYISSIEKIINEILEYKNNNSIDDIAIQSNKIGNSITKLSESKPLELPCSDLLSLGNIYKIKNDLLKSCEYYNLAYIKGSIDAAFLLGNIFEYDLCVKNNIQAYKYYKIAADNSHIESQLKMGFYYLSNDMVKSFHYFLLAANQDIEIALLKVAYMFKNGIGTEKDFSKAFEYFNKAAANYNNSYALLNIGYIYESGEGVEQNSLIAFENFQKASNNGDSEALYKLGCYYRDGICVSKDLIQALHYFKLSAKKSFILAMYETANVVSILNLTPDLTLAFNYYKLLSDNGHLDSILALGCWFRDGKFVNQNLQIAIRYFELASSKRSSLANYYLGLMYYDEIIPVSCDSYKFAYKHFVEAAKLNCYLSAFKLGIMFEYGRHVKKNLEVSLEFYKIAADKGLTEALIKVAKIYYYGIGCIIDLKKSLIYFKMLLEKNKIINLDHESNYIISQLFNEEDKILSFKHLTLAADGGILKAQLSLALAYELGSIVGKNYFKSFHYYRMASDQGDLTAKFKLASCYKDEIDIADKDLNLSSKLIQIAADGGIKEAQILIAKNYELGVGVAQDLSKSFYYYSLAAQSGDANAQFKVGIMLADGLGVDKDIIKSAQFLQLAFDQGIKEARLKLLDIFKLQPCAKYNELRSYGNSIKGAINFRNLIDLK